MAPHIHRPPIEEASYQQAFTDGVAAAVAALREMARTERRHARRASLSAAATAIERDPDATAVWAAAAYGRSENG